MVAPAIQSASEARPCPVCGGDHKCGATPDGLILCGRRSGPEPGFRHLGACKDPQWHMFRRDDGWRAVTGGPRAPARAPAAGPQPPDWDLRVVGLAADLTPPLRAELAARLGLPEGCLGAVGEIGWDAGLTAWAFPERDPTGKAVGVLLRSRDGAKRAAPGGRRGLTLAAGWAAAPGPVFLVEGPSDVLALAAVGLAAVGRPSNRGGADMLAALLRPHPARPVVVVGENDRKGDGTWPGRDGAAGVAADLARMLGRPTPIGFPPAGYKDCRDWVRDLLAGQADPDPGALGRAVAEGLLAGAKVATPPPARFPHPTPVSRLPLPGADGVGWVWDGFLARDAVTLLSALPKAGKTTLLAHLLAALPAGGEFCGRRLEAGRAVVVSEEPAGVWAARRDAVGLTDAVRVVPRGAVGKGSPADWEEYLAALRAHLRDDPADLVVFDTLAALWPIKDENSAADVGNALAPLHALCGGRAVLVVHHLRKSDGAEGTAARGSGALAGFVDVILELRRAKGDPTGRRRVVTGYGRYDAIPADWEVELVPGPGGKARFEHRPATDKGEDDGADRVGWVAGVLPAGEPGLTAGEVAEALTAAGHPLPKPEVESLLRANPGGRWRSKRIEASRGRPYSYWREEDGDSFGSRGP